MRRMGPSVPAGLEQRRKPLARSPVSFPAKDVNLLPPRPPRLPLRPPLAFLLPTILITSRADLAAHEGAGVVGGSSGRARG